MPTVSLGAVVRAGHVCALRTAAAAEPIRVRLLEVHTKRPITPLPACALVGLSRTPLLCPLGWLPHALACSLPNQPCVLQMWSNKAPKAVLATDGSPCTSASDTQASRDALDGV